MSHCGNSGQENIGDTILSLRKVKKSKGKTWARPSLTFILDKDHDLGEMRGRANTMPKVQYHPHIMALLLYKEPSGEYLVRTITGINYSQDRTFNISQLSPKYQKMLQEKRPELFTQNKSFRQT